MNHELSSEPPAGAMKALARLASTGVCLGTLLMSPSAAASAPAATALASKGKAVMPVVVGKGTSERVQDAARSLAATLARITGADFEVVTGDGQSGLAVGRVSDFPLLKPVVEFKPGQIDRREEYLLRSHSAGVYLLGATELAVEDAVWDFLHRLGYRQYFPGETWEIVPSTTELSAAVDAVIRPYFHYRRMAYGFGSWRDLGPADTQWKVRNRMQPAFVLHNGHSYDGIYQRKKAVFDAHPEYLALVKGERRRGGDIKFCLSNPDLRKLLVDHAVEELQRHPEWESISADPSDGGNWCECNQCRAMGSVSDRVVTMANQTVAAINARFAETQEAKYVGINIYNEHSVPPTIRVDPRVIGVAATSFIKGGLSHDQVMEGWRKQGATVGVYEYFSVVSWDFDMPGTPAVADLAGMSQRISHFHQVGARILSAESSDNWGPSGLGHYIASRVLWDTGEDRNVETIRQEFLANCFGQAREPMARFYAILDGANRPMLGEPILGSMYHHLQAARAATSDAKVLDRIDALILYTRYQELFLAWRDGPKDKQSRLERLERLLRFLYRMHGTRMGHTMGMAYVAIGGTFGAYYTSKELPPEWKVEIPEGKNPWKETTPFAAEELDAILREGVAKNRPMDFQPVRYSENLTSAAPLKLPKVPTGNFDKNVFFSSVYLFTWKDKPEDRLTLTLTGGVFEGNRKPGPDVRVKVWTTADRTAPTILDDANTPADRKPHEWQLKTSRTGLLQLNVRASGNAGAAVTWPEGTPMTLVPRPNRTAPFYGQGTAYFYVPKGTKVIGGYCDSPAGEIHDPQGQVAGMMKMLVPAGKGYFSIPVPPGQDGKLWKLARCAHYVALLTVPPCIARNGEELLLPAEVVQADAAPPAHQSSVRSLRSPN